jgi:flagellar motor switch protein FliN/FliY
MDEQINNTGRENPAEPTPKTTPAATPASSAGTEAEAMLQAMVAEANQGQPQADNTSVQMPEGPVRAQRAEFEPFDRLGQSAGPTGNIELLLDVSLPVAIELGRTQMSIRDILELGSGSIVELDKLAGEPVDILVNNKPLAKGEVVVIDENFGVRITSLVPPRERLERLNA